jgi:hypothetical protein
MYDLSPMDRSPRRIEMSARYAPFWSIPTTSTSEACPFPVTVTCAVRGNHREVNRPPINLNLAGEPYWIVRADSVLSTTRPVLTRAAMVSIAAWTEQPSLHEARRVSYEWTTTQGLSTDLGSELTATLSHPTGVVGQSQGSGIRRCSSDSLPSRPRSFPSGRWRRP